MGDEGFFFALSFWACFMPVSFDFLSPSNIMQESLQFTFGLSVTIANSLFLRLHVTKIERGWNNPSSLFFEYLTLKMVKGYILGVNTSNFGKLCFCKNLRRKKINGSLNPLIGASNTPSGASNPQSGELKKPKRKAKNPKQRPQTPRVNLKTPI